MGESADWRTAADEIFASFGDVVRDATVTISGEDTDYDPATGMMERTTEEINTKAIAVSFKFKLFTREKYQDQDRTVLIRGSDFSEPVPVGSFIELTDEAGDAVDTFVVIQSNSDDAGTGAYYYLHLRKSGA